MIMLRRTFLRGSLLAMGAPVAVSAQGVCRVDGPTPEEILADLLRPAPEKPRLKTFNIEVKRGSVTRFTGKRADGSEASEDGVSGQLLLNGQVIGDTLENDKLKIQSGKYPGFMRYVSGKNFVQGPFGVMANVGDFLLAVGKTEPRTNILFHGGTKPWHSTGCILLGAIKSKKDDKGNVTRWVEETSALRTLRTSFYGAETPSACPNLPIWIEIG
jgi:hypothetical protein